MLACCLDHCDQPGAVVGVENAPHVLHALAGGGVHRRPDLLPFAGELTQAVLGPLHLLHDAAACGRVVTGDEVGVALAVVGRVDPPHRTVDARCELPP